jgi:hypothetical protein
MKTFKQTYFGATNKSQSFDDRLILDNDENKSDDNEATILPEDEAKWSSTEEVNKFAQTAAQSSGSGENPGAVESPFVSRKNKDFKPVNFDGNSLKRPEIKSAEPSQNSQQLNPEESFAWKDSTLDRKLKELEERAKKQSESRSSEINGFDKNIDKSIGNWSNLPKAPNPDVILLKKAREEKKVKKYLEDNYQHRTDLISPDPEIKSSENGEGKKIQGVGPKTKEGKYFVRSNII